jgi:hypothetical protein
MAAGECCGLRGRWARRRTFFVSYTSADWDWAEWIAWQLEADGYRVVFQVGVFIPGYDWAHGMQHATATAERLVAVLSAATFSRFAARLSGAPCTRIRAGSGATAARSGE